MVDPQSLWEMTWKMLLAVLVGGLVGYEREIHGRPAGLRTHILVCFGAALFTIASIQLAGIRFDPGRIAAQIVSGIGFLGAGTIIRQGSIVRGLTTAASLWTVAAIGLAVGVGGDLAYVALIASIIVFSVLSNINRIEHRLISQSRYRDLLITIEGDRRELTPILTSLVDKGVDVLGLEMEESDKPGAMIFRLRLRFPPSLDIAPVNEMLINMPSVRGMHWG